jgi:hypothetical protein
MQVVAGDVDPGFNHLGCNQNGRRMRLWSEPLFEESLFRFSVWREEARV